MARTPSSRGTKHSLAARQPRALAVRLAACAHQLRSLVLSELNQAQSSHLLALYQEARTELLADLTHDDFADLLAQTLVYCFLLVHYSAQEKQRTPARALSDFLATPNLPRFVTHALTALCLYTEDTRDELRCCVSHLAAFLSATALQPLLATLDATYTQSDALMYFYEIFLAAYAPSQRSQRGVYYTPAPVITYMVRALDYLLQKTFAYAGGLTEALQDEQADSGVLLCDPACGTGAFLWSVLNYVRQVNQAPILSTQARLTGYEIMPSAYILASIELAMHQAAMGSSNTHNKDASSARLLQPLLARLSLLNSLFDGQPLVLPGSYLPIILGNPPYAGHSLNHSNWLDHLLESYKAGDSRLRKPAQTKWLHDDYVQFLRLAQWQIEQAGQGIVAFLTSHSYLDNPTFRAMRLSLLQSFDEIYVLNLHGNSKRRELAPGGERDCNIFMIQQGVAISIFVKWPGEQRTGQGEAEHLATVHYADVWGKKATYTARADGMQQLSGGKLGWLAQHDLRTTQWQTSRPSGPFYLFAPRDERYQAEYLAHWSLPAIFALNGDPAPGLVTCHDEFAISWSAADASTKIDALLATHEEADARNLFRLCTQQQWDYTTARRELQKGLWRNELGQIHYRPFDTRWTVFERHVAVHLRERVTRQMRAGPNLALAVGRAGQVINGGDHWDIAFCSRLPTEFNLYRRGGNYLFPLYLYPSSGAPRIANLAPQFITEISQRFHLHWQPDGSGDLRTTIGPDDIFAYIYALLYAPSYRARYASFLKIDFPRIPLPTRIDLFRILCSSGHALSQAHLLDHPLSTRLAWQAGSEQNMVTYVRYHAEKHGGTISINNHQYLEQIPTSAWTLTIGGYQIAKKWLWDRRGQQLSASDLAHYCQIIASLTLTDELMKAIDHAITDHGGWPL